MRTSIDRLRVWLLVGAALLAVVIAGFLGYARYRTHRFLAGLPGRLGVDIRRETNGYTYSQSVKGKTVMTLHAAKAVEHMGGKVTLHDVAMILYGRKQDRADRISGAEFEYDQASGVVRAVGEVHIDLQAPAGEPRGGVAKAGAADEGARVIHVKTSGLVYVQKLAVAATDQQLEFQFSGVTGRAMGAEYNSDTGVLILQSAVRANGLEHGRPVVLTASHAELEREAQRALLTEALYVSPGQTARGDHAIVHLRVDGSPERIEAEGHVALEGATAGTVTAPHADVLLSAAGQAESAHLFGGVGYAERTELREGKGEAQDARVAFDAKGRPEHVALVGAVHVHERARAVPTAAWSERDATAGRMMLSLAEDGTGARMALREAEAFEAAHLRLVSNAGTPAAAVSELAGDALTGRFAGEGKSMQLTGLVGKGHTSLRRVNAAGAEQTSAGETLEVALRAGAHGGGEEIARAVQAGHVVLTSRAAASAGVPAPSTTRATADLAVYDGDADHLTLTGQAQVMDAGSTVSANRIVMEHGSGDATADGGVKASYLQAAAAGVAAGEKPADPVHVLADRAELHHDASRAVFYGGKRPARLWQGASQVEAPVIEVDQAKRSLTAHGGPGEAAPVHAVLSEAGSGKARPAVARIASRTMLYLDEARRAEFGGGVLVEDADGTLRARQAVAWLRARPDAAPVAGAGASKKDARDAGVSLAGGVERIVATGQIEIEQPGRRASGEELVYTANDGMFVLTGTPAVPPKMVDEAQGTVTGAALRFHTGDDRVMISGDAQSSSGKTNGQRVHTVTRVRPK